MVNTLDRSAVRQLLRASEGHALSDGAQWEELGPAEGCWVLKVRVAGHTVEVELAPAGSSPALRTVGGLQLSYRGNESPPKAIGVAACDGVANRLRPGDCAGEWQIPEPPVPNAIPAPERALERISLSELGEEGALLETDLRLYAFHFSEPTVYRVGEQAFSLRFPLADQATRPANRQLNSAWLAKPMLRDYLESLGFRWDTQGYVDTVPTPLSLSRLLSRAEVPHGFRGQLTRTKHGLPLTDSRWLGYLMEGIFPTPINHFLRYLDGQAFTRLVRSHLGFTPCGMLAHDMSIHLLVTHRVPPDAVARYRRRIREGIPTRGLRYLAPSAVIRFFEDLLTTECQALWEQAESPADFDAAFADRSLRLEAMLAECIRAGLDDAWRPLRRFLD